MIQTLQDGQTISNKLDRKLWTSANKYGNLDVAVPKLPEAGVRCIK